MAASPTERSWCVLEFVRCNSFVAVQSALRRQFGRRDPPMKLQKFLFQMVVTSCISVQYLWKYGFAKYSDNLYAPCIIFTSIMNRFNEIAQLIEHYMIYAHLLYDNALYGLKYEIDRRDF
jgi:hypothetical protein